jgi:hypothetical protein
MDKKSPFAVTHEERSDVAIQVKKFKKDKMQFCILTFLIPLSLV